METEVHKLNFNFPVVADELIETEIKIKQDLRNNAYNREEDREIERYSDNFATVMSIEKIMEEINIELLNPELTETSKMLRAEKMDVGEDLEEPSAENAPNEESHESLQGDDDYNFFYNDDEDLVNEQRNNDESNNVF
ncbi:hypothetical protein ENBRE01_1883 [Enteropsectra breve]|nr:hypothetical protein ENBRE01_1883 [Enteropsectra breve]